MLRKMLNAGLIKRNPCLNINFNQTESIFIDSRDQYMFRVQSYSLCIDRDCICI